MASVADCRSPLRAAPNALQTQPRHQALYRTTGYLNAFQGHLPPNFAGTVHPEIVFIHPSYFGFESPIPFDPLRQALRIGSTCLMVIVRRWGHRQLLADRLDPMIVSVLVDKRHHHFGRRSSSAWAKKAAALRSISFARLSSRFSRSNSLKRAWSELANPSRLPWLISDCRTHLRKVSALQTAIDKTTIYQVKIFAISLDIDGFGKAGCSFGLRFVSDISNHLGKHNIFSKN